MGFFIRSLLKSGLFVLVGVGICRVSMAAETHSIEGVWRVDVTKTMKFSAENYRETPFFLKLFGCSLNSTALTFTADTMELSVAAHECDTDGQRRSVEAAVTKATYSTVFDGERQMAVVFTTEDRRNVDVNVLNWTSTDQFWVDMARESDVTRYYFEKD
jgi:hypothetical protein